MKIVIADDNRDSADSIAMLPEGGLHPAQGGSV